MSTSMTAHPGAIADWDIAYENAGSIPGAADFVPRWNTAAETFRADLGERAQIDHSYAPKPRNVLDLFMPDPRAHVTPRGLVVFIHGGYWKAFDKSTWSWLAAGPLAAGYAVALPSYTLCPDARITDITQEMAVAVTSVSRQVDGPIYLTGHSAGGHLVTRLMSANSPLSNDTAARVKHVLSISGVHDLRPLLKTKMNDILNLDIQEATRESPALLMPRAGLKLTCWVGAQELDEFVRQNDLLASAWRGCGANTKIVHSPGLHHFNVIDGLSDVNHGLTRCLLGDS